MIGGVRDRAVERAARIGDGFTLGFRNWTATREQVGWYRDAGGRGPIILRGGPMLVDAEHAAPPATWTQSGIVENLALAADEGITEFVWDLNIAGYEPARQIDLFEELAEAIGLGTSDPGRYVVTGG